MYNTNEAGLITDPGKFEGEPLYVPYFWDRMCSGDGDHVNETIWFQVDGEDQSLYPELAGIYGLVLSNDTQGFVYCDVYRTKEEFERAQYAESEFGVNDKEF